MWCRRVVSSCLSCCECGVGSCRMPSAGLPYCVAAGVVVVSLQCCVCAVVVCVVVWCRRVFADLVVVPPPSPRRDAHTARHVWCRRRFGRRGFGRRVVAFTAPRRPHRPPRVVSSCVSSCVCRRRCVVVGVSSWVWSPRRRVCVVVGLVAVSSCLCAVVSSCWCRVVFALSLCPCRFGRRAAASSWGSRRRPPLPPPAAAS